jgi:hypothetical protein
MHMRAHTQTYECAQIFLEYKNILGIYIETHRPRWSSGSVLATGPKVHGFKPGRGRSIFKGDKNPWHDFLWRGSEAVGPMS